jgi:predicted exporter
MAAPRSPRAGPLAPPSLAWVLGLWLLAMLVGGVQLSRTQFTADLSAFLPASPDARQRVLIEQLQSGVAARTLFVGIEGGDATQRAAASRGLAAALRASGLYEQVQNGDRSDPAAWQATGDWLLRYRYHLSPAVTPEHFSADGLRAAIDDTLSLLGTPAGAAVRPLLERDPTGEVQRIAESLIPAQSPRLDAGVWASRQMPRALLLLSTRAEGSDLDGQAAAIDRVRTVFAALGAPGLQLQISGAGVFAVESRTGIEREVKHLALVGLLALGSLLLLAFASVRALFVALLPVGSGIMAGVVAVSLVFGNVHGITLGFGSTLIGEAVDYAIYYLIQARGAAAPGTGWLQWRTHSWPTVRLGVLTSVCGFAALVFSGFPGLAQLGVFSIAGLCGAALATRFVLPALMPDGAAGLGLRRYMGRFAAKAVQVLPRGRLVGLTFGVASVVILVWQGGHLWRGDLMSLSPVPVAAQELDASLRADIGASDAGTLVVVHGADAQAALRAAEAAASRLDALVDQGVLGGYDAPTRLLPSVATQQARLAALPSASDLRQNLQAATAGGPLAAARLEPFVDEVQAARALPPLDTDTVAASPLAPLVGAMLMPRSEGWSALLALHPVDDALDAQRVRDALQGLPGTQVVDIGQELGTLYSTYLREALWQALLGALAVVALLAAHLRSRRRLVAVCQPLALAVLLTLGGFALLDVPMGILHLVGLLLVVAVGSNYALFFNTWRAGAGVDEDTLASLLLANVTTVVAFGLIALSDIPALSAIGRVVAPGAFLALVLSAIFARPTESAPVPSR